MPEPIHEYSVVISRQESANPPAPTIDLTKPFTSPGSHTASIMLDANRTLVVDVQPQYAINKLEVFVTIVEKKP